MHEKLAEMKQEGLRKEQGMWNRGWQFMEKMSGFAAEGGAVSCGDGELRQKGKVVGRSHGSEGSGRMGWGESKVRSGGFTKDQRSEKKTNWGKW